MSSKPLLPTPSTWSMAQPMNAGDLALESFFARPQLANNLLIATCPPVPQNFVVEVDFCSGSPPIVITLPYATAFIYLPIFKHELSERRIKPWLEMQNKYGHNEFQMFDRIIGSWKKLTDETQIPTMSLIHVFKNVSGSAKKIIEAPKKTIEAPAKPLDSHVIDHFKTTNKWSEDDLTKLLDTFKNLTTSKSDREDLWSHLVKITKFSGNFSSCKAADKFEELLITHMYLKNVLGSDKKWLPEGKNFSNVIAGAKPRHLAQVLFPGFGSEFSVHGNETLMSVGAEMAKMFSTPINGSAESLVSKPAFNLDAPEFVPCSNSSALNPVFEKVHSTVTMNEVSPVFSVNGELEIIKVGDENGNREELKDTTQELEDDLNTFVESKEVDSERVLETDAEVNPVADHVEPDQVLEAVAEHDQDLIEEPAVEFDPVVELPLVTLELMSEKDKKLLIEMKEAMDKNNLATGVELKGFEYWSLISEALNIKNGSKFRWEPRQAFEVYKLITAEFDSVPKPITKEVAQEVESLSNLEQFEDAEEEVVNGHDKSSLVCDYDEEEIAVRPPMIYSKSSSDDGIRKLLEPHKVLNGHGAETVLNGHDSEKIKPLPPFSDIVLVLEQLQLEWRLNPDAAIDDVWFFAFNSLKSGEDLIDWIKTPTSLKNFFASVLENYIDELESGLATSKLIALIEGSSWSPFMTVDQLRRKLSAKKTQKTKARSHN